MRLSGTLCGRRKLGYIFKLQWKVASEKKIMDAVLPQALVAKSAEIVDANEFVTPSKDDLPKVEMPEPYLQKKPSGNQHPSWKPRTCHVFTDNTRLLEGQEQAQILTKTVLREGLPKRINDLMDKTPALDDRDEILKRYILQSTAWDGMQTLLPRRLDITRPGHIFDREYGISKARQINTLSYNLLRLLDNQVAFLEDSSNRSVFRNCHLRVPVEKDGDLLKFDFKADVVIAGANRLPPFADADDVQHEAATALPDIFPIKYTVDLEQTNIYELDNFFPLLPTAAQPYVHTLYLHQSRPYPLWQPRHVIAKALSMTYAFAVAQAIRDANRVEVNKLEQPVAMQCVVTDGREFSLLAFQLNTLDLDGRNGIRNMAWLETGLKLYEESKEAAGKLCFEGFNPKVIDRLSAMHLNGLDFTKHRAALLTPQVLGTETATIIG